VHGEKGKTSSSSSDGGSSNYSGSSDGEEKPPEFVKPEKVKDPRYFLREKISENLTEYLRNQESLETV
jgi:hypothetical protein